MPRVSDLWSPKARRENFRHRLPIFLYYLALERLPDQTMPERFTPEWLEEQLLALADGADLHYADLQKGVPALDKEVEGVLATWGYKRTRTRVGSRAEGRRHYLYVGPKGGVKVEPGVRVEPAVAED